jgi:DNA-binding transcriptional LysR family regulator
LFADPLFTRSSTGVNPTKHAQVVHKDLLVSLEAIEAILNKRNAGPPSASQQH